MARTVRELMTEPVTVPADTSLTEAARLMRDADLGDLVVVDESGAPRGIVTDRDIVVRGIAEHRSPDDTTIGSVCTADLVIVAPDDDLERAAMLIRETAVRRLPVVHGQRVVGVIALGDLAIERDESSALADITAADPNS